MVVDLVGVYVDGAPLAEDVPANPRRALRLAQGQAVTVRLRGITSGGVPLVLGAGDSVVLTAKRQPTDPDAALEVVAVAPIPGGPTNLFALPVPALETAPLKPGTYFYDVWLVRAAGARDPLVPLSPLYLEHPALAVP